MKPACGFGCLDMKPACGFGCLDMEGALVLVMLGNSDVRLYDATLSEWATDPSPPMETG
jgi:3-mercaptopyruvate sulfurtransferase SseA